MTASGDAVGPASTQIPGPCLSGLLTETRRLLGCTARDVPAGATVADWLRISRVVEAMGDDNPLYLDVHYGARSWWRTLLAPPAFVLAMQVPESSGGLNARAYDVVDVLTHIDLWWHDHIRLGDRVSAKLRVTGVGWGQAWRGRDTVEITSRALYRSEGREVATGTGVVRAHPLRMGEDLFVERAMHRYSDEEIARITGHLGTEPDPRGQRPRFYENVSVADPLPELLKGPLTWSDLISWIIAEGRPVSAGNLHHRTIAAQPGSIRANPATGWPASDRRQAREDPQSCQAAGFPAPCARGALLVALATQLITTWMGDDAFLRHLAASLEAPALYGDSIHMSGKVTDKFTQRVDGRQYFAVWVEVSGVNQVGDRVLHADGLVFLPQPGHPVVLPVERGGV